jgi:hypothetical protein
MQPTKSGKVSPFRRSSRSIVQSYDGLSKRALPITKPVIRRRSGRAAFGSLINHGLPPATLRCSGSFVLHLRAVTTHIPNYLVFYGLTEVEKLSHSIYHPTGPHPALIQVNITSGPTHCTAHRCCDPRCKQRRHRRPLATWMTMK